MEVSGHLHAMAALFTGRGPRYPLDLRDGLDEVAKRKALKLAGNRTPVFQSLAQSL
jgi:hypothetical protein